VSNSGGCTAYVTKNITVGPTPPPQYSTGGTVTLHVGSVLQLTEQEAGVWTCNDNSVATVDVESGLVTGISTGRAMVTFNGPATSLTTVVVTPAAEGLNAVNVQGNMYLTPNPNNGEFSLKGTLVGYQGEKVDIEVTDMLGQTIYRKGVVVISGKLDEKVMLENSLANGMYLLILHTGNDRHIFHFVIER